MAEMELRQPKPRKNPIWAPVIVFKNKVEVGEFDTIQAAFRYFRHFLTLSNTQIYRFIESGVFDLQSWPHNGDLYEFRTYEERRKRHFEELKINKATGRKGR